MFILGPLNEVAFIFKNEKKIDKGGMPNGGTPFPLWKESRMSVDSTQTSQVATWP